MSESMNHSNTENYNHVYMTIPEASKATGLSMYFLRKGLRENMIPHILTGNTYLN